MLGSRTLTPFKDIQVADNMLAQSTVVDHFSYVCLLYSLEASMVDWIDLGCFKSRNGFPGCSKEH